MQQFSSSDIDQGNSVSSKFPRRASWTKSARLQLERNLGRNAIFEVGHVHVCSCSVLCLEVQVFDHLFQYLSAAMVEKDPARTRKQ